MIRQVNVQRRTHSQPRDKNKTEKISRTLRPPVCTVSAEENSVQRMYGTDVHCTDMSYVPMYRLVPYILFFLQLSVVREV